VRDFIDFEGRIWTAHVERLEHLDPQGSFYVVLRSDDGAEEVVLDEVRWHTERMAWRMLHTRSDAELRRRLRTASEQNAEE
jgi:hypothetical protein